MTTLRLITAAIATFTLAAGSVQAAPVFQQTTAQNPTTGWTSQVGTGQGGYQTFDDFTVAQNARIDHVTWRGTYLAADAGGLHGAAPNTGAWTVEFWSGNAAGPLQQLYSQDYTLGQVNRSLHGTSPFGGTSIEVYDFSLDLSLDFDVMAGQQYWFSVVSKSGTFSPFFSWTNADGAGNAYQRMYDGTGRVLANFVRGGQRAFTLESNAVPEPASLALAAGALLAGGMASRRRKAA